MTAGYDRMAAPTTPLRFADGTEYRMSAVTDRDISELDEWVRAEVIRDARASLVGVTDQDLRDETLRVAIGVSQSMTWMSGRGAAIIATVRGMTRLCWQCIRREHPTVTEDELRSHMFSAENVAEVNRVFEAMNSHPSGGGAGGSGKPSARSSGTRSSRPGRSPLPQRKSPT